MLKNIGKSSLALSQALSCHAENFLKFCFFYILLHLFLIILFDMTLQWLLLALVCNIKEIFVKHQYCFLNSVLPSDLSNPECFFIVKACQTYLFLRPCYRCGRQLSDLGKRCSCLKWLPTGITCFTWDVNFSHSPEKSECTRLWIGGNQTGVFKGEGCGVSLVGFCHPTFSLSLFLACHSHHLFILLMNNFLPLKYSQQLTNI